MNRTRFTTDRATDSTDRDAFLSHSCIFEPCYQLTTGFRHLKMVETQHHSRSTRVSLFPLEYTWHFSLAFRRRNASERCHVLFQGKKQDAIWTRVMFFECFACKNARTMSWSLLRFRQPEPEPRGQFARSRSQSRILIKNGAPRKVVSNSYQTYRTASGMKWTNFRLSLLWISRSSRHRHPEKGDYITFKTVNACLEHSIWFPCDRIMKLASFDKKKSSSSRMGYVHIPGVQ